MDDFEHRHFQSEMTHAIADLRNAQKALQRAWQVAAVTDDQTERGWALAVANVRSALLLANTLSVEEAANHYGEEHETSAHGRGDPVTAQ